MSVPDSETENSCSEQGKSPTVKYAKEETE